MTSCSFMTQILTIHVIFTHADSTLLRHGVWERLWQPRLLFGRRLCAQKSHRGWVLSELVRAGSRACNQKCYYVDVFEQYNIAPHMNSETWQTCHMGPKIRRVTIILSAPTSTEVRQIYLLASLPIVASPRWTHLGTKAAMVRNVSWLPNSTTDTYFYAFAFIFVSWSVCFLKKLMKTKQGNHLVRSPSDPNVVLSEGIRVFTQQALLNRVTLETCDLWDIWSEWWGDTTWPKIPTYHI